MSTHIICRKFMQNIIVSLIYTSIYARIYVRSKSVFFARSRFEQSLLPVLNNAHSKRPSSECSKISPAKLIVDVTRIFDCSIIPTAATSLQKYQKPYAGVVVFHLPCALEVGMNIDDTTTFRVSVSFFYWSLYSSCKVCGVNNLLVCTLMSLVI